MKISNFWMTVISCLMLMILVLLNKKNIKEYLNYREAKHELITDLQEAKLWDRMIHLFIPTYNGKNMINIKKGIYDLSFIGNKPSIIYVGSGMSEQDAIKLYKEFLHIMDNIPTNDTITWQNTMR